MAVQVRRPRTVPEIRALIRTRRRNIANLERALSGPLPKQDRDHLRQRLAGERANMQSWVDYLEKKGA